MNITTPDLRKSRQALDFHEHHLGKLGFGQGAPARLAL
jgi:hypothetical protein